MASVKISNLPSGNPVEPGDVLIYNDTSENTTKKVAVESMFFHSKTVNVTSQNGGAAFTISLFRLAPRLAYLQCNVANYTVTNDTSAATFLAFTTDTSISGSIIPVCTLTGLVRDSSMGPVAAPSLEFSDMSMHIYCDTTSGSRRGCLIPANSSATISFSCKGLVELPADF